MSTKGWGFRLAALAVFWLGVSIANAAFAATWYFSPNGSDASGNGSSAKPWLNPGYHNAVYQPGDTLSVAAGTYTPEWGWSLTASGSAAGGYITLQCAADHASRIRVSTPYMMGISVMHGGAYWNITGCDVVASGLDGSAIAITGGFSAPFGPLHHIVIQNNIAHDSSCSGIGGAGNTNGGQPLDYIIIRNNIVYGNAKTSGYDCSGISIYEPVAYDSQTGDHLLIQQNISYNNSDCDACHAVTTDGNGIIMDDFLHTQTAGRPYTPTSLVENNVAFNNGGNGVHMFLSQNIRVRNNTAWGDVQDPKHCGGGYEIGALFSKNIQFYNNIAQSTRHTICAAPVYAVIEYGANQSSGDVFDWNIAQGVGGNNALSVSSPGFTWGAHNQGGVNPMLAGPIAPIAPVSISQVAAAFVPKTGSPALHAGSIAEAPSVDLLGTPRRTQGAADLGAIQVGP